MLSYYIKFLIGRFFMIELFAFVYFVWSVHLYCIIFIVMSFTDISEIMKT